MHIHFTEAERRYILDDHETDLVLTEVGLRLVDRFDASSGVISVEANEVEEREFLAELRHEFVQKIERVAKPELLRGLARRLLPDYPAIASATGCPPA